MASEESDNRRKYPRLKTESVVTIARVETGEALAYALDLSQGGIRFQCLGLDVQLGEVLQVTLTLGNRTVTFSGQLVRVTDLDPLSQEVAMCFTEIDDETLRLLAPELED